MLIARSTEHPKDAPREPNEPAQSKASSAQQCSWLGGLLARRTRAGAQTRSLAQHPHVQGGVHGNAGASSSYTHLLEHRQRIEQLQEQNNAQTCKSSVF